jgi:multidrug efflux pump subunit AcrA (membrane-fusion protein)
LLSLYGLSVSIPQDVVKKMGLRDGYSARIAKVLFEKPDVITVPKTSLRRNGKDYFVLVAASKDGVPSPRAVSVGLKTASEVEIIKGLAENELVAIDINGGGPTP